MIIDPGTPWRLRGIASDLLQISARFEGQAMSLRAFEVPGWRGPASTRHRAGFRELEADLVPTSATFAQLVGALQASAQQADQLIAAERARIAEQQRHQ